jgi:hypothetical protein
MSLLTKSKYMSGLQCTRLLWFANKKQLPEVTLADQHKFNQGAEFEKYAHKLFEDAINLSKFSFADNLKHSKESLEKNKVLFEAGFTIDDLYIRSDVLEPHKDGFNLYEIKSTNDYKPEHIEDLAYQKCVLEKKGIKIYKCSVIHLNKEFKKQGKIDPKKLCKIDDLTEEVKAVKGIEGAIKEFKNTLIQIKAPEVPIGKHCNKPYECPLKDDCWNYLPKNNIFLLTNWRVYWKLFEEGVLDLKDIPRETKLTDKDSVILESTLDNERYVSLEHIKHFLKSLNYPLYHFDFETFMTAVPIFDNSKPWQQIPFQYSLHIEQEDGNVEHREFLADSDKDPRISMLKQMKKDLEGTGDIIVFNKSFEITRLKEMADDFPEHKEWINDLIPRIIDLALPFQKYYYYDPKQKGRYSIKAVLPAITGKGYKNLEINSGGDASVRFFYSHIKPELKHKDKIRANLLKYCCLDTEGMIWIIDELRKIIN